MILSLKNIIDLNFLLGLDEDPENADTNAIASRDRDIFRQIKDADRLDDAELITQWIECRRGAFVQETGNGESGAKLPGELFESFYLWIAKWVFACGLAAGCLGAYSFLAYHGSRPVNVTLFIAVFILFPTLLCLAAALVGLHHYRSGPAGSNWAGALHQISMRLFIDKFMLRLQKWASAPVQKHFPQLSKDVGDLLYLDTRPFRSILFWPVFILLSLGALGFSTGVLSGTFFRIMVTDLAFGWQSTLLTSGEAVHRLVTWMALPWSWALPDMFVPTLEQIEGSRIILKEGIAGLSSEHLAAWWPFLCMGLLVYTLIPRIVLVSFGRAAKRVALSRFDLSRPGYQRLLMRMRTPRMGMKIKETGGSRAEFRAPLPRPEPEPVKEVKEEEEEPVIVPQPDVILNTPDHEPAPKSKSKPKPEPKPSPEPEPKLEPAPAPQVVSDEPDIKKNTQGALVLGSARGFEENDMEQIRNGLEQQFGIHVAATVGIHFDFDEDRDQIASEIKTLGQGPLIVLQEVWQPPIRGLLYYFVQIREAFSDFPLWIVMIQTMEQKEKDVTPSDVNFQVWKSALNQLKDPMIVIERWVSP